MKTYAWILSTVTTIALAALMWGTTSCDKIADGDMRSEAGEIADSTWGGKYVVLEDFTGVRCQNCPAAAEVAKSIKLQLGSKLILIEHHPKGSVYSSLTDPHEGDVNLTSEISRIYADFWKVPGLPKGLVNRKQGSGKVLDVSQWTSEALKVYEEPALASLEATAVLSASGNIEVKANGEMLDNYTEDGELNILVLVLEDGFSVTQTSGAEEVENYAHDHVCRVSANGDWGAKVLDAKPSKGAAITATASIAKAAEWNGDKLSVVVMLCNATTQEILQARHVEVGK